MHCSIIYLFLGKGIGGKEEVCPRLEFYRIEIISNDSQALIYY
jgi:hypothetical protein